MHAEREDPTPASTVPGTAPGSHPTPDGAVHPAVHGPVHGAAVPTAGPSTGLPVGSPPDRIAANGVSRETPAAIAGTVAEPFSQNGHATADGVRFPTKTHGPESEATPGPTPGPTPDTTADPAPPNPAARAPVYTTRSEVESLGVSLGPALHDACGDRLGDIEWFRSPWQKSGAATGNTAWRLPNGRVIDAIVKAPVGYREYFWSTRLGEVDPMWWDSDECEHLPVPRVLASGMELGGYDIAYLVQERVAGQTVGKQMDADRLRQLFFAAARFHAHTRRIKPAERTDPAGEPDWRAILDRARTRATDNGIDRLDEWLDAIDAVDRLLPALLDRWHARPMDTWCHGDLHPGNVMIRDVCDTPARDARTASDDPRCGVLLDFALVHPGHWVEDALYLERMYWGHEAMLGGVEPVRCLAEHRLLLGMHADETDEQLADIRRLLMGVTSPAFLHHENDPVYLAAAIGKVRGILPQFGVSL